MSVNFDELDRVLSNYRKIFFEPLRGNHGDDLIKIASLRFLEDRKKILVNSPAEANAIVINGGGGMTSEWGFISYISKYIEEGAKTVIVFPSSIHEKEEVIREILDLAKSKRCELLIFAREKETFNRLVKFDCMKLFLSHDMAFYLKGQDIFREYLGGNAGKKKSYSLIVERRDSEGTTNISRGKAYRIPFKKYIPDFLKRPVKRALTHKEANTEFYNKCRDIIVADGSGDDDIVALDISSKGLVSFREFISTVVNANHVFTNRLHVCILRNIFNKSCYLLPTGGQYKKNESIYAHSMVDMDNIKLL
jgi:exopolysaccharide biosynthesis predicted pyruvyltransferase EpsI